MPQRPDLVAIDWLPQAMKMKSFSSVTTVENNETFYPHVLRRRLHPEPALISTLELLARLVLSIVLALIIDWREGTFGNQGVIGLAGRESSTSTQEAPEISESWMGTRSSMD